MLLIVYMLNGWPLCKSLYVVLILCQSFGCSKTFLIRKNKNLRTRISIVKIPCVPIFRKNTTLTFSTQICPKINLGVRIASPDSESALPRYHVCQFSVKTDNFDFFLAQICPKGKLGFQMQGSVHFLKRGMIQN